MATTVYVDARLQRIGWCEILRDAVSKELVAVPSLVSHDSPKYLHVSVTGNRVTVSVEKRST